MYIAEIILQGSNFYLGKNDEMKQKVLKNSQTKLTWK